MTPNKTSALELKLPDWLPEDAKNYAKTNLRVLNLYIRDNGQLTENQNIFFTILKRLFTEDTECTDGVNNGEELERMWKALSKRDPKAVQNFCYCIGNTFLSQVTRGELPSLTDFNYKCSDLKRIFRKIATLLSQCNSYTKLLKQHINISLVLKNIYLYEKACYTGELPRELFMNSDIGKYMPQIHGSRLDTIRFSLLCRQFHPLERPSPDVFLQHDFCNLLDLLYAVGRVTVELIKKNGAISYKIDPLVKMQNKLEKQFDQAILILKQDQQEFFNVDFKTIIAAIIKGGNNKPPTQIALLEYMHNPEQGFAFDRTVSEKDFLSLEEFFQVLPDVISSRAKALYVALKDEYETRGNAEKYLYAVKLCEFMTANFNEPLYYLITRILKLLGFTGNLDNNKYIKETISNFKEKKELVLK